MDCPQLFRPRGHWIAALVVTVCSVAGARGEMLMSAVVNQPTLGELKANIPFAAEPGTTPTVIFHSTERLVPPDVMRFFELTEEEQRAFAVLSIVLAGSDTIMVSSSSGTGSGSTKGGGSGTGTGTGTGPTGGTSGSPDPVQVPEPGTILLGALGAGLVGFAGWRKSRRQTRAAIEEPRGISRATTP